MGQKSLLLLRMTLISKFGSIERNAIVPSILTLPNPTFQTFQDLNMSNGKIFCTHLLMASIDARYLNGSTPARAYRLETFRSMGTISLTRQTRCYFVTKCDFVGPNPSVEEMRDL